MMASGFDTYDFVESLRKTGFKKDQAAEIAKGMQKITRDNLATKSDLENLRLGTQSDLENLRLGTQSDMENLRLGTQSDMENLRLGTQADIEKLRLATKSDLKELKIDIFKLFVPLIMGQYVLLIGVLLHLTFSK